MAKQGSLAKNWCFTLNNFTKEEVEALKANTQWGYLIFGEEIGKENTPHLQGYLQMNKQSRITAMKKINKRAHWEIARGSAEDNKKYTSKEGVVTELGIISEKGKVKVDMVKAINQTIDKMSTRELMQEHGSGYIMNKRKIDEVAHSIIKEDRIKKTKLHHEKTILKKWQKDVVTIMENQSNREILFVVDEVGNSGKTYLSKYLVATKEAIRFENGKSADIKYIYEGETIVIFDFCRSQSDHINYEVIESIKNGIMMSTKYESEMKIFSEEPKMIVMMNCWPDVAKLSKDRYTYYDGPFEEINE